MRTAFEVLAEPARRVILDLLVARPRTVAEIVGALGASQPGTSKHLRVLRDAGLVTARVVAQQRVYEIDPAPLAEIDAWLEPYRRRWSSQAEGRPR